MMTVEQQKKRVEKSHGVTRSIENKARKKIIAFDRMF